MHSVVITGTGLHQPPYTITNAELVESFNRYVAQENARHADAIAAGTRAPLQPSSVEFIEKASGIKQRYVFEKEGILDPQRMYPRYQERSDDQLSMMAELAVAAARQALQQAGRQGADIDAVLWNTWRALKSGGLAVFELWNAAPILMIGKKEMGIVSTTEKPHLRIDRERGFELVSTDPAIVEVRYRYHVRSNGSLRMLEDTHRMRAFALDELKLFIAKNGFKLKSYYANAQKDGFSPTSNRTVIVLEK